jgi:hypothetical protein
VRCKGRTGTRGTGWEGKKYHNGKVPKPKTDSSSLVGKVEMKYENSQREKKEKKERQGRWLSGIWEIEREKEGGRASG